MPKSLSLVISCLFYGTGTILFVSLLGCGGKELPAGFPKLYPCTVTVTQEGEPLVGAIVRLHPSNPLEWTVSGKTDGRGTAVIHTHGIHAGAPAGDFKVTVDKLEAVVPPLPANLPTDEEALNRLYNQQEENTRDYRLVEPGYSKVDSTTLTITIDSKKTSETFDVGKKYRELAR